jgi:hypothetical protein
MNIIIIIEIMYLIAFVTFYYCLITMSNIKRAVKRKFEEEKRVSRLEWAEAGCTFFWDCALVK